MYVLKRAVRSNGSRIGDIVPLGQVRMLVHLVPRFGAKADPHLTAQNSMEYSTEFFLNNFADKEVFFSLYNT
jgi:hypothetical protein